MDMENSDEKKVFVLDTSVILHDPKCIRAFGKGDVVVPIVVIEELNGFKKGNDTINRNAREFTRFLDSVSGEDAFNGGMSLGKDKGVIKIKKELALHPTVADNFRDDIDDNRILNLAYHLNQEVSKQIILVSKDINLRLRARSLGIKAKNYREDAVIDNVDRLYQGFVAVEGVDSDLISRFYKNDPVLAKEIAFDREFWENECLILKNGSSSALARVKDGALVKVKVDGFWGIKPKNVEQTFALALLRDDNIPLVTVSGKAGTGKTLFALLASLDMRRDYQQIFIARPTVPLSNKDLGYLPGDMDSKLGPYMQPLYDNLDFIKGNKNAKIIEEMLEREKMIVCSLAFIRGRSLTRKYFIIDEAQNLSPHEVKTIITRAGEGTKIVFTGDVHQIDHPYLDSGTNGLSYVIEKMKEERIAGHINLSKGERSELANRAADIL